MTGAKTLHDFMEILDQHRADGHWTLIGPNGTIWVGSALSEIVNVVDEAVLMDMPTPEFPQ